MSGVQVQFAGNPARKAHQILLIIRNIGIRHEEVPVLAPPMETSTGANNQPALTISNNIVQDPKVLKTPTIEEFIVNNDCVQHWREQDSLDS